MRLDRIVYKVKRVDNKAREIEKNPEMIARELLYHANVNDCDIVLKYKGRFVTARPEWDRLECKAQIERITQNIKDRMLSDRK